MPSPNNSTGQFDAFIDIEGQCSLTPGIVFPATAIVRNNTFVAPTTATSFSNGIMVGGQPHDRGKIKHVVIADNVFDASKMPAVATLQGVVELLGAESPDGVVEVLRNRIIGVNDVFLFSGNTSGGTNRPKLKTFRAVGNTWFPPRAVGPGFVVAATQGVTLDELHLEVVDNDMSHGGAPWLGAPVPRNAVVRRNAGWNLTQPGRFEQTGR